jgi:hypothetical protein
MSDQMDYDGDYDNSDPHGGRGCKPASGNDANVSAGGKVNSRPDTKNTKGNGPSTKGALFH